MSSTHCLRCLAAFSLKVDAAAEDGKVFAVLKLFANLMNSYTAIAVLAIGFSCYIFIIIIIEECGAEMIFARRWWFEELDLLCYRVFGAVSWPLPFLTLAVTTKAVTHLQLA